LGFTLLKSVDLFERNAARAPSRGTPACSGSKQPNKFFLLLNGFDAQFILTEATQHVSCSATKVAHLTVAASKKVVQLKNGYIRRKLNITAINNEKDIEKRGWKSKSDDADAVNKSIPAQHPQNCKLQHELNATHLRDLQLKSLSMAKPELPTQCLAEGAEPLKAFAGSAF
jgi:hypothetical protein